MSTRGFLIYAHNNEEIDYGKMALVCALMIKAHLRENQVCLATDEGTLSWLQTNVSEDLISKAFDHIKIVGNGTYKDSASQKRFLDTKSTTKNLTWYNGSRNSAYELSPFDETIVMDSDVLVQDKTFDLVWGNEEDLLVNCEAITLDHQKPLRNEQRLESLSIKMYWATMVYFRKTERAKLLFDIVSHVKEKYPFYQYVYDFPGRLYRNDFAFSIAIHMMNGFVENNEVKPFPQEKIMSSFDTDDLVKVGKGELIFLANDLRDDWKFHAIKVKGINVHVMNKYALMRHADQLIELYR